MGRECMVATCAQVGDAAVAGVRLQCHPLSPHLRHRGDPHRHTTITATHQQGVVFGVPGEAGGTAGQPPG